MKIVDMEAKIKMFNLLCWFVYFLQNDMSINKMRYFIFFTSILYAFFFVLKYIIFKFKQNKNDLEVIDDLEQIDTKDSAEYFANRLNQNLTFFLNGEWGTGKTVYLSEVQKYSNKKFININLWNIKDERTVISICFSELHPIISMLSRLLVVLAVVISILVTPAINLDLSNLLPDYFNTDIFSKYLVPIGTILALVVSVWQFFKFKTDSMYYKFFQCDLSSYFLKNKVLIIDDFDRVSKEKQEESYKLFNSLNGKLAIVFVGDYTQINIKEDKYLQKIINQKIELPYNLHPRNIWENYFKKIETKFSVNISTDLTELFIKEQRNLRERKIFHYYLIQELENRNKKGIIQIEQQLIVIYLYLFYHNEYKELVNTGSITINKDSSIEFETMIEFLLTDNDEYPTPFLRNREGYYLYEKVLKMKYSEVIKLLNDENITEHLVSYGSSKDGFFEYISRNYNKLDREITIRLRDAALDNIYNNKDSHLIDSIILFEKQITINKIKTTDSKAIIDEWEAILNTHSFDFTQKLFFFEEYLKINFANLAKIFPTLNLESTEFIDGQKQGVYFIAVLSINNKWNNFEWSESYWNALKIIFNKDYQEFLYIFERLSLIKINWETSEISLYTKKYNHMTDLEITGVPEAAQRIKPMLTKISNGKFTIKEIEDKLDSWP
ncbi:TPA: P-loop NTPase fold protein [Enterococcus faecium]